MTLNTANPGSSARKSHLVLALLFSTAVQEALDDAGGW